MRIVIVGKTKMKGGICIGGLAEDTAQPLRLIPPGATCNPTTTPYDIGDIWEMDVKQRRNANPPHVEDHDVLKRKKVGTIANLAEWLRNKISPWTDEPSDLFDGTIKFRGSGTAYVAESGPLPNHSTGFWIVPRVLEYCPFVDVQGKEHPKFALAGSQRLVLPYVGLVPPVPSIPARTMIRLSLSRPWTTAPDHIKDERERHSVQLSGWF